MEEGQLRSFTELLAWQKCRAVRKAVLALVRSWPAEERFRLSDQIIRSSRSACANIAEGFGRFYEKENMRFCRMAKGSLYETLDHLSAAFDEGCIDKEVLKDNWALVEEAIRVLNGYLRYLRKFESPAAVSEPNEPYAGTTSIFAEASKDMVEGVSAPPLTTDN